MKNCNKCAKSKPENEFSFRNKEIGLRHCICKECCRPNGKEHYRKYKKYYVNKAKQRGQEQRVKIRELILETLSSNKCFDCGIDDARVLEFDHIGDKKESISKMLSSRRALGEVKMEMEKCEIVCANCHRIRTYKRLGSYRLNFGDVA